MTNLQLFLRPCYLLAATYVVLTVLELIPSREQGPDWTVGAWFLIVAGSMIGTSILFDDWVDGLSLSFLSHIVLGAVVFAFACALNFGLAHLIRRARRTAFLGDVQLFLVGGSALLAAVSIGGAFTTFGPGFGYALLSVGVTILALWFGIGTLFEINDKVNPPVRTIGP